MSKVPLPFTKEEVEWWTEQAEKLKPFWYLFENIPCGVIIRIVDAVLRGMNYEQVESNEWYIWERNNEYFMVYNGFEAPFKMRLIDRPQYADMLSRHGYFTVGISKSSNEAECALRIIRKREVYLPFLDISLNDFDKLHNFYLIRIILDRDNIAFLYITPHKEVQLLSSPTLRISKALAMEYIKRITQQEDIRRYVEEAIDEAVELFNEFRLPTVTYLLY
jgi:hypothetical protein